MHGRVGVRLGEVDDRRSAGRTGDLGRQFGEIANGRLGLAEEPETRRGSGDVPHTLGIVDEVVLAVPGEGEEPLGHPPQKRRRLDRFVSDACLEARLAGSGFRRPGVELVGQRQRLRPHRDPVFDGDPDVGQHRFDFGLEVVHTGRTGHAIDLEVDE